MRVQRKIFSDSDSSEENISDDITNDSTMDDDTENVEKNFIPEIFFSKSQKQFRYYKMIDKYFKTCDPVLVDKMVKIINKDKHDKDCISLRVLEWVVTKCSKKNIDVKIDDKEYFSINIMYKAQLKSYKKKNFDPFRRDRKFYYNYDKKDSTKTVITTVGQLNFFKWAISNKIIDCVEKHYETINNAMNKYNKDEKTKKLKKVDKTKDSESTKSTNKKEDIKVTTNNKSIDTDSKSSKPKTKESFVINFD
jgi:hypothetical protein